MHLFTYILTSLNYLLLLHAAYLLHTNTIKLGRKKCSSKFGAGFSVSKAELLNHNKAHLKLRNLLPKQILLQAIE